ncbi:LysR family transcriptional regulator [Oceanimonas sp. NS1]|nr:LysR family transcriptional regulator [Oceanimonas sp. NS1]
MSGAIELDLKQLRVLQSLLQERSVSRVAGKMGLTQQAISEQLRKMRALFGDRLFIRQGNSMVPTPLAEQLGLKASRILSEVDDLLTAGQFEPEHYQGTFCISANDYAIQAILPRFLESVRADAPNMKIIVRDFVSDNLEQLMATGEIDLALSFPPFIPASIHYLVLFEEQHICITARHSKRLEKTWTLEEVARLPQLIVSPSRANLRGSHDEWFALQGLKRNIVMSVPSFSAAPDIIGATDMISFYPSRLLPNPKVASLQLDTLTPKFEVIVAWHSRTRHSPLHTWMLERLKALFVR